VPRRVGEATLFLYETGMVVPLSGGDTPSSQVREPLAQRKVIVTAS